MSIQDWANDNDGYVDLNGHLFGALQRQKQITGQQQQTEALKGLQREIAKGHSEQQSLQRRQNLLYSLNLDVKAVRDAFNGDVFVAYQQLCQLREDVHSDSSNFHQCFFPSLEWKTFCDETLRDLDQLTDWAERNISADIRTEAKRALLEAQEEEAEAELARQHRNRQWQKQSQMHYRAKELAASSCKSAWYGLPFPMVGIIAGIYGLRSLFNYSRTENKEGQGKAWLGFSAGLIESVVWSFLILKWVQVI